MLAEPLYAQQSVGSAFKPPVFVQSSPEVAAFTRYGDVPVSLYTGVPDISIPLHTIKANEMEVPISVSYHAGGITVDQEATIVGLGWTLMAGGHITVSPVGARDIPGLMSDWNKWQSTIDYIASGNAADAIIASGSEDRYCNWGCVAPMEGECDEIALHNAAVNGMGEHDIYTVSLPHRSFKFFLHPATNEGVIVGEKNKCKIQYQNWRIIITDELGGQFFFEVNETDSQSGQPLIWYLTKMTDVFGNEIVFEYEQSSFQVVSGSVLGGYERVVLYNHEFLPTPAPRGYTVMSDAIPNILLKTIETDLQKIVFTYSQDRSDVEGSYLKAIEISDKVTANVKKKFRLNYGYFVSSNFGRTYFLQDTPYSSGAARDGRLKLQSVVQVNPLNDNDTLAYIFNYDERYQLPPKSSFAKDFWGFFNGQRNASNLYPSNSIAAYMDVHTLLPDPRVMKHIQPDFNNFDWGSWFWTLDDLKFANRFCDGEFITTGSLKSITYPTGGRTEFEFEPHTFYNQRMFEATEQNSLLPARRIISVSDLNDPYGYTTFISDPFEIAEPTEVRLEGGGDSTKYNLQGGMIGILDLTNGNPSTYSLSVKSKWDVRVQLPPGLYRLICSAPGSIPFQNYEAIVWAKITYLEYDRQAYEAVLAGTGGVGGGIRVKKITDFDSDNRIVRSKEYRYERVDGSPSGKMLRNMDNFVVQNQVFGWTRTYPCGVPGQTCRSDEKTSAFIPVFHADNLLPIHNSTSNAIVGYDRVVVREVSQTGTNGEKIVYYKNDLPGSGVGFELYNVCTNGSVLKEVILSNALDSMKRVDYFYEENGYTRYRLNMKVRDNYTGPTVCVQLINPWAYIGRYHITAYAYTSFLNQLIRTETYEYSGNIRQLTRTDYVYDETNFQPDQISNTTSDGRNRITYLKFPHDKISDFTYSTMFNENRVNTVIEQKDYIDNRLLKTQENRFMFWLDNQIIKVGLSQVSIGFSDKIPEEKITFLKYDAYGNVLQYRQANENLNTVLFRGYPDSRVVAKIVGDAGYDQIVTIAGSYLNQLDDNISRTQLRNLNSTIRNMLPDAHVITYTYDPLYGITSETDPNGITTYYEYDGFGRLVSIKDHDENLIKHFQYNYSKHTPQ